MTDTVAQTEAVPVPHWALDCAHFRGVGSCTSGGGCWQEPRCAADEPPGGWTRAYAAPVTTLEDAHQVFREAAQSWADELGAEEPAIDIKEFTGLDRTTVLEALAGPADDPTARAVIEDAAAAYCSTLRVVLLADADCDGPLLALAHRLDEAVQLRCAGRPLPELLRWYLR